MDEESAQKHPARRTGESAGSGNAAAVNAPGENASDRDLSHDIERSVEREPLDFVKCVRVFGNYYRCNWWSRAAGAREYLDYAWTGIMADIVRKSCFLNATMNAGELTMQEISPGVVGRTNLVREG
jgi:hypothetical protein